MAGEEVFTSNALVSMGSAFFFLALYVLYETKGMKGMFKPLFFIAAILAIINGWAGQALAYEKTGLYDASSYITNFWVVALSWVLYGLLVAALIDLGYLAIMEVIRAFGGEVGKA